MTRKDYILIASALRDEYQYSKEALAARGTLNGSAPDSQRVYLQGRLTGVNQVAVTLAAHIKCTNFSFDTNHFLAVVRGEKDLNSKP